MILRETGENPKEYATICFDIANIYKEKKNKDKFDLFMDKAIDVYHKSGDQTSAQKFQIYKKEQNSMSYKDDEFSQSESNN